MDNWKIIMRSDSATPFDIYLAKSYLESNGLETQLQDELTAQVYSGSVVQAKLLVKEDDLEQGIKILTNGGYIKT